FVLEAAFGQAEGYIDQYFAKASYKFDIAGSPLTTSYQFYGTRDKVDDRSANDLYDGTAWLQALTFGYRAADVWICVWKAPGLKPTVSRDTSCNV
ncbi:hypothetical protein, partial [Pseudomonas aeruginosa]|uniref:hypothetical protein n=1 Tax=Pseudomonas aeruginosa TaxID=287 RepID=UPI003D18A511